MRRAVLVVSLLSMHAGLLAWQAYRYSPTIDEPAHLVSGISHWKFGRFDLYRVNPPLVRLVAALPMLVVEPKTDWSAFTEAPYARPEFSLGTAFANANGFDTFWHFTLARWACIPFSLIGGWYCYRWANELYGKDSGFRIRHSGNNRTPPPSKGGPGGSLRHSDGSSLPSDALDLPSSIFDPRPSPLLGLMALALWCFCPNILGNGTLITPDVGAASLGVAAGYYFWRWLREPTWTRALLAGLALGLAELTKSSWIVLFALWPALWLVWIVGRRKGAGVRGQGSGDGGAAQDSGFGIRDSGAHRTPPLGKGGPGGVASIEERIQDSGFGIQEKKPRIEDRRSKIETNSAETRSSILHPRSSIFYPPSSIFESAAQLASLLALALYLLNLGYGFENSFQRLGKFQFISRSLGGPEAHEKPGNRFADSWLAALPVPVPANHLLGIDVQKYDFEKGKWSYLRGEQKMGGWWYYYLYAMGVKMPAGTLFLIALTCVLKVTGIRRPKLRSYRAPPLSQGGPGGVAANDERIQDSEFGIQGKEPRIEDGGSKIDKEEWQSGSETERQTPNALGCDSQLSEAPPSASILHPRSSILNRPPSFLDELVLLAPALLLIALVSSQTGFNRYLRYVVPAFPFLYIWISQLARYFSPFSPRGRRAGDEGASG